MKNTTISKRVVSLNLDLLQLYFETVGDVEYLIVLKENVDSYLFTAYVYLDGWQPQYCAVALPESNMFTATSIVWDKAWGEALILLKLLCLCNT